MDIQVPIKEKTTVVLYTDGSALSTGVNTGAHGSGVHGYTYVNNIEQVKKHNDQPNGYLITDIGYVEKEQVKKTECKPVTPVNYIDGAYALPPVGTSNIAEIEAVTISLEYVLAMDDCDVDNIIVKSDSKYALGIIDTLLKGIDKSWDTPSKINYECWIHANRVLKELNRRGITLTGVKVLGHSTDLGNNLADRLAFIGRNKATNGKIGNIFDIVPANKYWKSVFDRHPLLRVRQLFFLNTTNYNHTYAIMNYKTDMEPGRKTNDVGFGLVRLSEEPYIVDKFIAIYNAYLKSLSIISTINLDVLYSAYTRRLYDVFNTDMLVFNPRRNMLTVVEEEPVVLSINPPGLANQAIKKTLSLSSILDDYKSEPTDSNNRRFIDITNEFFTTNDKGKLVCTLPTTAKNHKVVIHMHNKDITIPLELGKDLLDRNNIKRLEKRSPKITMITNLVTDGYVEYHIVVELLDTNDVGIYCNFYNNGVYI